MLAQALHYIFSLGNRVISGNQIQNKDKDRERYKHEIS